MVAETQAVVYPWALLSNRFSFQTVLPGSSPLSLISWSEVGYVHSSFSLGLRLLDPNIEDDRITNVPTRPVHAQFRTEREVVVFVSYICVHFTEALVIISNFSYRWLPLLYPQISPHIVKDYTAARNHVISCWFKTDSTCQWETTAPSLTPPCAG